MLLFLDGFDKYGGVNSNTTSVAALMAGDWTTITGAGIAAPLSATGQALTATAALTLSKTLSTSYSRLIGGVRFSSTLGNNAGVQFLDGASNQTGIQVPTTGLITLRSGAYTSGTVLGTAASAISANTTHYLEWDITFGASAAYNVYLDGVSIISGTGHTTATANNSASAISLQAAAAGIGTIDDLYLFDSTGSINNAPLLNSPRIETTFPTSDSAAQLTIGASVLGPTVARTTGSIVQNAANMLHVRPFTPSRACTLNSITMVGGVTTNGTVNWRPVVYTDSAGAPTSLITSGSTVTGVTAGTSFTMALTSPASLTAGTQYWLGFMMDTAVTNSLALYDGSGQGRYATSVTFASGAPSTCPTTTTGASTVLLWGNITLSTPANFYEVSQSPPPAAATSYVLSSTVGQEDLYAFNALSVIPANLYAVSVKAFCQRSDTGARTVSMRVHSGSTDSGGTLTGQTPGTSQAWLASNFETDPNGGIAWTGPNLNAATSGFRIDA